MMKRILFQKGFILLVDFQSQKRWVVPWLQSYKKERNLHEIPFIIFR